MRNKTTRNLVYTALCIAIGLVLPQTAHFFPIQNFGSVILPMHIPVLIAGFIAGPFWGLVAGIITPLLSSILTGMPPMFPYGLSMMLELGAYGLLTGLLYKATKGKIFVSLIGAMIGGRIVYGIFNTILFSMGHVQFGFSAFIAGAFVTALPGIIIQLIVIPIVIRALERAKLIETYE